MRPSLPLAAAIVALVVSSLGNAATPVPPLPAPSAVALVGGTLVDGNGGPPLRDAMVLIRDGKIACVGARGTCPLPAGAEVIDVTGSWITPGLIDAHVHFSQTGWADGRPDALDLRDRYPYEQVEAELRQHPERFFASYLCSGVTGVFDVGGYPWTWDLRRRAENDVWAPHVAAAGPLLSTRDHWLNLPAERQFIYLADEKAAREGVRYLAAFGSDAVKVWFIMVKERPFEEMAAVVRAAGEEARRLKLPLIVHATGLKEAKEAMRAGARMLVHSVIDLPVDVEFLDLAKQNGTIYCPTLTVFGGYVRMFDAVLAGRAPLLDDPNHCVDAATRVRIAEAALVGADKVDTPKAEARKTAVASQEKTAAANLKTLTDAAITVAMGTDAGNPMTLHGPSVYAEMEAMQAAGMTPMQVLVASTRNGAQAMGRLSDFGTVEKGKVADLIVLAGDPTASTANFRRVRYVVRAGVVHPIAELRTSR